MRQKLLLVTLALILGACGRSASTTGNTARASSPAGATKYVGSAKSNIYHLPTCRSATKIASGNLITFASREDAAKAGYRPCEVCKP